MGAAATPGRERVSCRHRLPIRALCQAQALCSHLLLMPANPRNTVSLATPTPILVLELGGQPPRNSQTGKRSAT